MIKKIINAFKFISKNGLFGFATECYYRLVDTFYENYFGVNTKGLVPKEVLKIESEDSREYCTVHYKNLFYMLDKLNIDKSNSVLLDFGCGKGRAIIAAARYGYLKIIGVEISFLINIAKKNVEQCKHKITKNIELLQCDATDYYIPIDVNVIYFFNPFVGLILHKVTNNIYSSLKRRKRKLHVIFFNNGHFDEIIANQDWIIKVEQFEFYPHITCGLYETKL